MNNEKPSADFGLKDDATFPLPRIERPATAAHAFQPPWPGAIDHCTACGQHSLHTLHVAPAKEKE